MTTHLGHVIETTERYTVWLTEGITGAKQQQALTNTGDSDTESTKKTVTPEEDSSKKENMGVDDSDVEFKVFQHCWRLPWIRHGFVARFM